MARMNSETYALSLSAMMASLSLLFLYMSIILPTAKLSMYAISSLFVFAVCMEKRTSYAFLIFIVVSLLSFLILPDMTAAVPYILFFGHYGIAKYHIEGIKDKFLAFTIKLAYFNVIAIIMYLITKNVLLSGIPDLLKDNVWALLVVAQVAFVAYDFVFSKLAELYYNKFRPFLIKRGRQ